MSVRRVEAELEVVKGKIAALRSELTSLERWEGELHTTLHVFTRLAGSDPDSQVVPADVHTVIREKRVDYATGEVRQRTVHRGRPLATGKALEAGEALVAMLRVEGKHIRPMDAVRRLRDEHGIQIGLGKPGRETSDLSAAIGHGRIPGLVVTRSQGWGLAEWDHRDSVIAPFRLATSAMNAGGPGEDDPTDYDLINDEIAMNRDRPDDVVD